MKDRIVLLVMVVLQFFRNQWVRLVVWLRSLGEVVAREPKVKVGDVVINPRWIWITVVNQPGSKNANGFHRFGQSAGINEGGRLMAVAIDSDQVLVSYENPKGQGAGSVAGNGTLFFVPRRVFASMTAEYDARLISRAEEKIRVLGLLRRSLELELLNHRRQEV